MDLNLLREFVCLSEDLNFTKAAARCYLSQSVLSRHVQAMEQELGCKLVIRDKQGIRLTPAGETFAEGCRQVLADYEDALASMSAISGGFDDILRISYMVIPPDNLLERAYALELERHPRVKIEMLASWEERALVLQNQGKVDLSIMIAFAGAPPEGSCVLSLGADAYDLVVPAGHPLADRTEVAVSDLAGQEVLIPSRIDHPIQYDQLEHVLAKVPRVTVRDSLLNSLDAVALANAGHGVALVRHLALKGVYLGSATVLPVSDAALHYDIRVEWKKSDEGPMLSDFIAILRELRDES